MVIISVATLLSLPLLGILLSGGLSFILDDIKSNILEISKPLCMTQLGKNPDPANPIQFESSNPPFVDFVQSEFSSPTSDVISYPRPPLTDKQLSQQRIWDA
jgi:hypothetical protein